MDSVKTLADFKRLGVGTLMTCVENTFTNRHVGETGRVVKKATDYIVIDRGRGKESYLNYPKAKYFSVDSSGNCVLSGAKGGRLVYRIDKIVSHSQEEKKQKERSKNAREDIGTYFGNLLDEVQYLGTDHFNEFSQDRYSKTVFDDEVLPTVKMYKDDGQWEALFCAVDEMLDTVREIKRNVIIAQDAENKLRELNR